MMQCDCCLSCGTGTGTGTGTLLAPVLVSCMQVGGDEGKVKYAFEALTAHSRGKCVHVSQPLHY